MKRKLTCLEDSFKIAAMKDEKESRRWKMKKSHDDERRKWNTQSTQIGAKDLWFLVRKIAKK